MTARRTAHGARRTAHGAGSYHRFPDLPAAETQWVKTDAYYFVIVGAGSAGRVLAHRPSEDPQTRVLLLEAGGADWDPLIHIPPLIPDPSSGVDQDV